jgi:CRISPR/Cas system-associated endoribonuclease Cas2
MGLFFVAYDLDKPGQNYQNLWDELESLGAQRLQDSVWGLQSSKTAVALRDTLKGHIDSNDRLLVVENGGWASWNSMFKINDI